MLSERERRRQTRFRVALSDSLAGELATRGARTRVRVADLSLGGAGLVVDGSELVSGRGSLELGLERLGSDFGGSTVELVRAWHDGPAQLAGVRFRQPSEPFLQRVCEFLLQRHCQSADSPHFTARPDDFVRIVDAKRARQLLSYCLRHGTALTVFETGGRPVGTLLPDALQGDELHGSVVLAANRSLVGGRSYHLFASTFASGYVLTAVLAGGGESAARFVVGPDLMLCSLRRHLRLGLDDDFPVYLELLHPHVRGKLVRKLATEVGLGGLSFDLQPEDDLLVPGTLVPSAVLWLPDGRSLGCRCLVRHVWRHPAGYRCGVELLDFAAEGRHEWVAAVLTRAHPSVVAAGPEALAEVWDVFDRSGYLEEKPAELMQAMREPFRKAWGGLLAGQADNQCWLYRADGVPMATVSMSRIYSSTWLLHHLGADLMCFETKQQNLDAMAEITLHAAPEWAASLHPDGYALTIFNSDKHFNRWSWFGFFERHNGEGELDSQKLRLRDYRVDSLGLPPVDPRIWVREATDVELRSISRDLLERDGPLVHRAYDFAPERIKLTAMSELPDGSALERRRTLYVAGRGPDLAGYAIVESAATGANIFSLYDSCRIVVLAPLGATEAAALRDALLARAAEHLRAQGCPCFLYLTGPTDAPPPSDDTGFEVSVLRTVMTMNLLLVGAQEVDRIWTHGAPSAGRDRAAGPSGGHLSPPPGCLPA
jgi:hypothetical protein